MAVPEIPRKHEWREGKGYMGQDGDLTVESLATNYIFNS